MFLMGEFYAESLILAETANSIGAIQVASSTELTQTPFFIAACDYVLIGDEFYAASAYLTRQPVLVGSLVGQDWGKLLLDGLVVLGVFWNTVSCSCAATPITSTFTWKRSSKSPGPSSRDETRFSHLFSRRTPPKEVKVEFTKNMKREKDPDAPKKEGGEVVFPLAQVTPPSHVLERPQRQRRALDQDPRRPRPRRRRSMFALFAAPVSARRPIVAGFTFIAGLYYVLAWIYPVAHRPRPAATGSCRATPPRASRSGSPTPRTR